MSPAARGASLVLQPNLAQEVLSETVPFTFTPTDFEAADFVIEWKSRGGIPGVKLGLGEKSLEWVRVSELFDLPRGELVVEATDVDAGSVEYLGFTQSMARNGRDASARVPVAMMSGERVPILVRIKRGGKVIEETAYVRFRPREKHLGRVVIDSSCSPFKLRVEETRPAVSGAASDWMTVGCRMVWVEGEAYPRASLETFIYWDNVGQSVEVDDIPTPSTSASIWALRLRQVPGSVRLKAANGREVTLHYSVRDRTRLVSLGLGVGPYAYHFSGFGEQANTVVPLLTWYGSVFLNEAMRVVAFSAMPVHRHFFAEFGLYLWNEQVRLLDDRFSMNVLLGARGVVFQAGGQTFTRFGGPQGVEFTFRDFMLPRHSITLGGFFFPRINNKAYYNTWIRWGVPERFIELNYLAWLENVDQSHIYSRSVGICVGVPIASFW